jgi:hypothetical protein
VEGAVEGCVIDEATGRGARAPLLFFIEVNMTATVKKLRARNMSRARFRDTPTGDAIVESLYENGGEARLRDLRRRFGHRLDFMESIERLKQGKRVKEFGEFPERGSPAKCLRVLE